MRRLSVVQAQRQIHRAFGPAAQDRSLRTIADHAGLAMDAAPGSGGPIRGAPVAHWQASQSRAGWAMRAIAQIKPTKNLELPYLTTASALGDCHANGRLVRTSNPTYVISSIRPVPHA
jgi:hypothetical protein